MKRFIVEGFDQAGARVGLAEVVRRGRRSGQWRIETDESRTYEPNYSDALRMLKTLGAVRIEETRK